MSEHIMSQDTNLTKTLVRIRQLFAEGEYAAVAPHIAELMSEQSTDLEPHHCGQLRLMQKIVRAPERFAERPFSDTLLWAFDDEGRGLMVRRGLHKRAFSGKLTVTACGHGGSDPATAAAAFRKDFDVELNPTRLFRVGPPSGCRAEFASREFWAVTPRERKRLWEFFCEHSPSHRSPEGVVLEFSPHKHSLTAFTLCERQSSRLQQIEAEITATTDVPAIHAMKNCGFFAPYVVRLTETETATITQAAALRRVRFHAVFNRPSETHADDDLAVLGQDQWEWIPWTLVVRMYQADPFEFALDLCQPCLSNDGVLQQVGDCL